ncbi:zinc-binding dehydrogenase [Sphingobium subterraneum]|uniref:zinc-binding dehydrogenase n=1 Tax=Sphingobium subterraneum TaxID=627688 RepID=UPI0016084219
MKSMAAVAFQPHEALKIELIDVDAPQAGEVLVEMKATGLCHTDLHAMEGKSTAGIAFPGIPGHEGAGIVREVGPGVTSVAPGDHVVSFLAECKVCPTCLSGKSNLCDQVVIDDFVARSRFSVNGQRAFPFQGLGTYTQYSVIREVCLAKVRKDAPFDQLSYFGCAASTGIGAALFTAKVEPGSSVIVFGMGGVGLNIVQGARLAGARQIIAVDINDDKKSIAMLMGATHFVNPKTIAGDIVGHLNELTGGGADFTFEAVGSTALMRQAFEAARYGWGVCTVVGLAEDGASVEVPAYSLLAGRKIQGSPAGDVKGRTQIPQLVDWMMDGKINVRDLISSHLTLENINTGFDMMRRHEGIRSVVTF